MQDMRSIPYEGIYYYDLKPAMHIGQMVAKAHQRANAILRSFVSRDVALLIRAFIGSRPSDHYFRSVCLFVCAEFFSAVFDPISTKLGHMLYVSV